MRELDVLLVADVSPLENNRLLKGDPYLGLGAGGGWLVSLAKLAVHGLVQGFSLISGGCWLLDPSLEAEAGREGT